MSREIVKYQPNMTTLIIIGALILLIVLVARGKGQYNEESVTIQRDVTGRISGMTVHRAAH